MYFKFFKLHSWGKRSADNRRRLNQRLLKKKSAAAQTRLYYYAATLHEKYSSNELSELQTNGVFAIRKRRKPPSGIDPRRKAGDARRRKTKTQSSESDCVLRGGATERVRDDFSCEA